MNELEQNLDTQAQNLSQENININPDVKQLESLVCSPDFEVSFLSTQTKKERSAVDEISMELKKKVEEILKPLIETEAIKSLGVSTLEEARKLGKQWGDALRLVQKITIEKAGIETQVDIQEARQEKEKELFEGGYKDKMSEAKISLEQATVLQKQIVDNLKNEIKEPNRSLLEALNSWGVSPNVKGESGSDNKGFNSGVVHYFEYRTSEEKNSRFKPEEEMTLDGFRKYTEKIKSLLDNPNPVTNPEIEDSRLLEDETGQRRLFIVTKNKELVVAFERDGQPMKIISIFPGQGIDKLNKAVEDELHPQPNAKTRLNKLNSPAHEVEIV